MPLLQLPPMGALRAFEAAARRASFKDAAFELSVTPTAISHQVRQLEAHLGVRVLDRSPRAVVLTAQGRILYDAIASSFAEVARAAAAVRGFRRTPPTLTLSATPAFLSQWLVPRLSGLRRVLPDLDVRLHASDQLTDLRAGGVDVAIRYGKGPFGGADAVVLQRDVFAPVCSPRLGMAALQDLARADLIHIDGQVAPRPAPDWTRWCALTGVTGVDTASGTRFTDSLHAVQAAVAGQGVAIVSLVLASDALASGLLVQPFAPVLPGDTHHFVSAPGLAARADVAALREWFVQNLPAISVSGVN